MYQFMHQRKNVSLMINTFYYKDLFLTIMYNSSQGFVISATFKRKILILRRLFALQKNIYYKSCKYYLCTHFFKLCLSRNWLWACVEQFQTLCRSIEPQICRADPKIIFVCFRNRLKKGHLIKKAVAGSPNSIAGVIYCTELKFPVS